MEIRQAISMYLTAKAYNDAEFKAKFENPNKNLDECVTYITWTMYKRVTEGAGKDRKSVGVAIPSDDEVFALAEQYYIDEDLKVDGSELSSVRVVSASATSFTDEEKAKMREEAIKKYQDDVIAEQKKKDQERKNKAKEKKPNAPVLVPDTPKNGEEPKTEIKTEDKPKAVQMDLFA
jgi:hypothetical protein